MEYTAEIVGVKTGGYTPLVWFRIRGVHPHRIFTMRCEDVNYPVPHKKDSEAHRGRELPVVAEPDSIRSGALEGLSGFQVTATF